jgi:hypothetical protein
MAARGTQERRPAIWPWLVMPLIVLVAFYVLWQVRQRPGPPVVTAPQSNPAAPGAAGQ